MASSIFVYWSDGLGGGGGGRAFDRHGIVGTGAGHLLTNNACWAGRTFDNFFSNSRGLPGGIAHDPGRCSRLELTRTLQLKNTNFFLFFIFFIFF